MKKQSIILTALLAILLVNGSFLKDICAEEPSILNYLPGNSEIEGWKLLGSPQHSAGTELFSAINGEAELYFRFGFKRAVLTTYQTKSGQSVNVDLFEMKDNTAAKNVFSAKTDSGKKISLGDAAILESYYLNFYLKNFQVTIAGTVPDKTDQQELLTIAKAIAAKITKADP